MMGAQGAHNLIDQSMRQLLTFDFDLTFKKAWSGLGGRQLPSQELLDPMVQVLQLAFGDPD